MRTISVSELRRTLAATLDCVVEDHEPVIIARGRGRGRAAAVLISLEDLASEEETRYLLQSPRNAEALLQSIRDLEEGRGSERQLAE